MKIKSVQFYDYRVFYAESEYDKKDYFIEVDSNNLLVYGENGSGKTSLFRGIKDIVHNEDFTSHFKTPLLNEGYLEITFDDNSTDRLDATGIKGTKSELLNVSKLNSFLSYKELLKTHLYDVSEINFFEIIVYDILKEHNLQTLGPLRATWQTLRDRNIDQEIHAITESVPDDLTAEEAVEQVEILKREYIEEITKFNDEFDELIESINTGIGEIVNYFNQGISINFDLEKLNLSNLSNPILSAKVVYATSTLPSHHKFLNEARLSAIAISIYLTALQTNPTVGAIKFIFLDDIFVGLDLNNRLPLLDILKDKFSDWQIFLTTYDRHWFEVAKQHLERLKWKAIEMYAGEVAGKAFEKPIIIQSEDYFEKADKYYKAGDYPAALNYLRKELESQIKVRLPEEEVRHYDNKAPKQISTLWGQLTNRYDRNGQAGLISSKIRTDLDTIKFGLLHPQSHDNLSSPVYKYELKRAFDLIALIQGISKIKGITLLSAGMELIFKHPSLNYSLTLELLKDWKIDIVGTSKIHDYPVCRLIHWQYNGYDFYDTYRNRAGSKPKDQLEDRFDRIRSKIISYELLRPLTEDLFNANTTFENIWTIKELLNRCDDNRRDSWFCRVFRKGKQII